MARLAGAAVDRGGGGRFLGMVKSFILFFWGGGGGRLEGLALASMVVSVV